MARPKKQGVDYFPLDVHLDNKFKFIEIKFGLEGFATVIKMMQEIYANRYYCDWGEDEQLLFSNEHNIDFDKLQSITNECVKRNIFNKHLYDQYKILTSEGIQKRYKEIVRRRVDVELVEDYLLIDGDFGISSEVNDDINPSSSSHNDSKSTQSKVKESKGNNNKQKYLDNVLLKSDEYKRLINEFGQEVIDSKIEDLDTYISNKGKNPYKDHNKTLRNWIKKDGTKPLSVKKKEQDRNELIEKMEQLRGSLELPDDYYAMSGTSIDREAVRKELSDIERQLHIN